MKSKENPLNQPFVAERHNGKIVNFPYGGYFHHFPNRKRRRDSYKENKLGSTLQQIFKWDKIHNKKILVKTIFHYTDK